ncbi:class I SAM-dependent methyltransferase [Paenibacillus glycanilyticus]|uniref:Class I SAM-dependent methyltransferase n=1 Tax=Paenibacillus glycanilyticus TaxID=126569 RepID=A0ABQ6GMA3_9BACL|nr:class I SAM-dependent methyltransferase [Paenibacillus glycanilyticus]GLX71215.1 hypothetical protein MU1_55640 [Paenibacillus glycanilyticus]
MDWKFYRPVFAVDHAPEMPAGMMTEGAWSGHRRFAYDLVRFAKPKVIVELGTLYGTSFFSFCQAIKDEGLSTSCYAVDTWQGDPHTGMYGTINDGIYQAVSSVKKREFPAVGTLLRHTFDEALPLFPKESIDILHIDGYHAYEAVLHDYASWLPKLAPKGVVLFHDTAVKVLDFGVHLLWDQLSAIHPHMRFHHSNGLGVLFPKGVSDEFQNVLAGQEKLILRYARG